MESKELQVKAITALNNFMSERDKAIKTLEEIVKAKGGFVRTVPDNDKSLILVMKDYAYGEIDFSGAASAVYGIRYIEGEGLCLCTEEKLSDYAFDEGFDFEFPIEDYLDDALQMKHLENALNDEIYFESFYDDVFVKSTSIIALLNGITQYL